MQQKSLELYEQLGSSTGMAASYESLRKIFDKRGDSDRAREMHQIAVELNPRIVDFDNAIVDGAKPDGAEIAEGAEV
jgi:hypothetical protein